MIQRRLRWLGSKTTKLGLSETQGEGQSFARSQSLNRWKLDLYTRTDVDR